MLCLQLLVCLECEIDWGDDVFFNERRWRCDFFCESPKVHQKYASSVLNVRTIPSYVGIFLLSHKQRIFDNPRFHRSKDQ